MTEIPKELATKVSLSRETPQKVLQVIGKVTIEYTSMEKQLYRISLKIDF